MPSRLRSSAQLSLNLKRASLPILVAVPEEAVSALADLLLAAAERCTDAGRRESGDEQQDYR
jgi:hypothetical protein